MISDRALWQRARPLFDELVALPHDQRQARLEAIGRQDPGLRATLERLLVADREAQGTMRDGDGVGDGTADTAAGSAPARDPVGVVGRTVSHFRVTDYLAAGGMGVVYRAEDLQLGRTVALKFPLPHQRLDGVVQERFVNEARSAGALDHPNLCTIHEVGESEHGVFLAMPLYPGETLRERLARVEALPPDAALDIVVQVVSGLASAHAAGIVHRDLKPGNVMLLPDGTVKVLDFGLAKIRDVDLTKSFTTLGTIGYAAPEQLRGGAADARTDLWAIGVMLYEALTGRAPFGGEHEGAVLHAVLHEEPRRPSSVNTRLSPAVDELIGGLLRKEPAHRYQSADALLVDLAALRRGEPLTARPPVRSEAVGRRARLVGTSLATAVVLAAAAASWTAARRRAVDPAAEPPRAASSPLTWVGDTAEIADGAELAAALVPANAGRHLRLRAGTYDVDRPLVVPDGMTIEGAGTMRFDDDGLPTGFADATRTTLQMTASAGGDLLTLGDQVTVRDIEVVDLAGRSGNVVAVVSRGPRDSVAAALVEVVIVNPNPLTIGAGGALGRGLLVVTRNLNMGADPAPHAGAALSVRMTRSMIRSPAGGGGLFAYNFAADGRILVDVSRSVIGGSSEANGGVSRPDVVHDAEVRLESRGNLYRNEWADPCASALLGWNLIGGSGAPIPIPLPETTRNRLIVRSTGDRIEHFTTAVLATGSRQFFPAPLNAAPTRNRIDLQLVGTTITTPSCANPGRPGNTTGIPLARLRDVADLRLAGAWVESDGVAAGSGNVVRVELRDVTGSGRRSNRYAHTAGPSGRLPAQLRGTGNRLEIVGDPREFPRVNRDVAPPPPAEFFTGAGSSPRAVATREPVSAPSPIDRANPPTRRTP